MFNEKMEVRNERVALRENLSLGFPTRSETNRAVKSHKRGRSFKVWIYEVEGLFFLCRENTGGD